MLGLDKQTENPKYAISLGNMSFDPVNAAKRGLLNTGIKNVVSGKLSGILGPAAVMGGAFLLAQKYNPLNPKAVNYNPNLSSQVASLKARGMLNDRNQITSGPLAGKNLVSMFGTNDYGQMLQDRVDYFEDRITSGKNYSEKGYREAKDAAIEEAGIGVNIDGVSMSGADYYGPQGDTGNKSSNKSGYSGPTGRDVHGDGRNGRSGSRGDGRGGANPHR
jgi:hypothetical protein